MKSKSFGDFAGDIVVLCGGLGTRLRNVQPGPKSLAEIAGRPFLGWLLDYLAAEGVRRVVLSSGYGADEVELYVRTTTLPVKVTLSREREPSGTGGALRLALPHLSAPEILVLNGDSFCPVPLGPMRRAHEAASATITIATAHIDDISDSGALTVDADGRVRSFTEKCGRGSPGVISAGIYLMRRQVIEAMPDRKPYSFERECVGKYIDRGLYAFPSGAQVLDIGTPARYEAAQTLLPRQFEEYSSKRLAQIDGRTNC